MIKGLRSPNNTFHLLHFTSHCHQWHWTCWRLISKGEKHDTYTVALAWSDRRRSGGCDVFYFLLSCGLPVRCV